MDEVGDSAFVRGRAAVRPVLRVGIVGLLLGPGVSKFLTYEQSVRFFTALSLPMPEVMVLIIGAIEVGVAMSVLVDRAPRVGAALIAPVIIVAAATAGPTWQNIGVFFAALALVGMDTMAHGSLIAVVDDMRRYE